MSETKFTPGPWEAHKESENRWRIVKLIDMGIVPITVAIVSTTVHETEADDGESAAANAQLVAAAPSLLAACKAMLNIDNPPAGQPRHIDMTKAAQMMLAAVQKAEPK